MNLLFFTLSSALGGFLISAACSYIFLFSLIRERKEILKKILALLKEQSFFSNILDNFGLRNQVEMLADEKLDNLVVNFKAKVPMVGMFLAGELEETLKKIAKEELLSMIPQIESNMISNTHTQTFYENLERRAGDWKCKSLLPLFVRLQIPSLIVGTILGALFGLILFFFGPN